MPSRCALALVNYKEFVIGFYLPSQPLQLHFFLLNLFSSRWMMARSPFDRWGDGGLADTFSWYASTMAL